ncbi:MAG: universal stress protein [Bacteroidetes bacterium]|nr:universal stress protein [Bacteroidota bacterium]
MKTIIAGTDFSKSSINACKYAAMLAHNLNCKLTIFNLYDAPIIHSNMGMYAITYSFVRKNSEHKASTLIKDLHLLFPEVEITSFISGGSFKDELKRFTKEHLIEAVVMGMETKNKLSKFLYGSHGVDIAGKIDAPVIIVPEKYTKHNLENVLLTVDNNEKLHHTSLISFEKFIKRSHAKLNLLHVRTYNEIFAPVMKALKINGKKVEIEIKNAKNLKNGVKNYCKDYPVDLVAIISKKHSVFYNLFAETNTKKLAFAANVPIMAIHE